LSVLKEPLPKPVLDPKLKSAIKGDDEHGLWAFFNKDRTLLTPPEVEMNHGRAWLVDELRLKSWDDLHCLWWVCMKERNRLATEMVEHNRLKLEYGRSEGGERDKVVRASQRAILQVLTERWYAWEDARNVARTDNEVDLTGQGPAFTPNVLSEDEYFEPEYDEAGPQREQQFDRFGEEHIRAGRDLPQNNFFDTEEKPKSLRERVAGRVKRVLWNR
jgi:large subunit ribosomal protein L47